MTEETSKHFLLGDRLGDVTRKERRNLLTVSAIAITMVKTNLIPTKITALGIEFSQAEKYIMLYILSIIIFYFLITFIIYSASDYFVWKYNYKSSKYIDTYAVRPLVIISTKLSKPENIIRIFRTTIDFIIPIMISVYAVIILIWNTK